MSFPVEIFRECVRPSSGPCEFHTELDMTLNRNITTTTCVCNEHRCNAFGPVLLDGTSFFCYFFVKIALCWKWHSETRTM